MNILIVEDNYAHQKITEYVLKKNRIHGNLFVVHDGQAALDYLFRRNAYESLRGSTMPDLILLDFNLPRRDGREVLKVLSEEKTLRCIPIVVISTSDREEDITYALEKGAKAYVSKSSGFDRFSDQLAKVIKTIIPSCA